MSLEVMLDLETLSLKPNAAIVSIGAVKFDPRGGGSIDPDYKPFYRNVELHDVVTTHRFDVDGQTLKWWFDSAASQEARAALLVDPVPLDEALRLFWLWFGTTSLPTWGNGANFDNTILRTAFEARGGECPFKYYHDRCFRTLKALYPNAPYDKPVLAHHALSDAEAQARHVQKLYTLHNL